jgi:adenine-specific DNA-methyltransferase
VWFSETKTPFTPRKKKSPFLGVHDGTGCALLYNGILGDRAVSGGNVLTGATLALIKKAADGVPFKKLVIYGAAARLGKARLRAENIEFKQTPYDVKAR